jgi:hypothetical protein
VIGGIEPVRSLLMAAFEAGKSVVSANKALLADEGGELHAAAAKAGVDLYYEAAVAGAIPLLRPLRESARRRPAEPGGRHRQRHDQLHPVPDGRDRARLHRGLAEATELGYAEADPTADVDGFDAAAKAAILASLAFHTPVTAADVYREGISAVTSTDVARAAEIGCTVKLLAICERVPGATGGDSGRRPRAPGDDPDDAPAGRRRRGVQRRVRRGRGRRAADVLRPGRRRATRPPAPSSATWSPSRATGRPGSPAPASPPTRACRAADRRDPDPVPRQPRRRRQAGRARDGGAGVRRHGVSIATVRQDGHGDAATLVIVTHSAPGRRPVGDGERAPGDARGPRRHQHPACGRTVMTTQLPVRGTVSPLWPGLIEAYRSRLPVSDSTPVVTLQEGATPLVPAQELSRRTGCDVYLKVEGANPTGSFKDRGMTVAISKAVEEGPRSSALARTPAAPAAAYAAAPPAVCAVLVPQGKIATGKLAHALVHGPKLLQAREFDDCLALASKLSSTTLSAWSTASTTTLEGQIDASFEVVDVLGDAPTSTACRRQAGNITAYWQGYREYAHAPPRALADVGLPGRRSLPT